MSTLSLDKNHSCGGGGAPQAASSRAALAERTHLKETAGAPASSLSFPIGSAAKIAHGEQDEQLSPPSHCMENESASSTSLDADDEADAGPPADTAELPSTPSFAPVYPPNHRWLVDSREGGSLQQRLETMPEEAHEPSTHDAHVMPPHSLGTEQHKTDNGASTAAPLHTAVLRCRRSAKRAARSNSPRGRREGSSSENTPPKSPVLPRSSRVSLSQSPPTFALSVVGGQKVQPGGVPSGDVEAASVVPAVRCVSSEGEAVMNLSPSPPAFSPSLATAVTAATATDYSDGSSGPRNSDTFGSPPSTHLRLAPRMNTELQQFGCCVFFFPAPLISWMFPLIGHVAISNAEGSRLFTFESSYYVREEKLVTVLDRVLREEMRTSGPPSPARRSRLGLDRPAQRGDMSDRAYSPSPMQSPLPLRGLGMSDASTSDAGLNSPSDVSTAQLALRSASTPLFPSRSAARPPRRSGRSKSSAGGSTTGHMHTRCVRIWDLKPLLMESRGRRTKRAPYGITRQGGKQAAAALWERLQELLQPTEGSTGAAAHSQPVSRTCGRVKADSFHDTDVVTHSATSVSGSGSSSGDEGGEYELLDAETAHFYNRNLNATIRLFRGSADGSNNSPDVVLQHHSSFSFVGFVLEACGIGSQAKLSTPVPAPTTAATSGSVGNSVGGEQAEGKASDTREAAAKTSSNAATAASEASGATAATAAESADSDEEIHWGSVKLLFHVFVFGKWHRGEGRLRRALHGGSITSAAILWVVILALSFHYFSLIFF